MRILPACRPAWSRGVKRYRQRGWGRCAPPSRLWAATIVGSSRVNATGRFPMIDSSWSKMAGFPPLIRPQKARSCLPGTLYGPSNRSAFEAAWGRPGSRCLVPSGGSSCPVRRRIVKPRRDAHGSRNRPLSARPRVPGIVIQTDFALRLYKGLCFRPSTPSYLYHGGQRRQGWRTDDVRRQRREEAFDLGLPTSAPDLCLPRDGYGRDALCGQPHTGDCSNTRAGAYCAYP